MLVDSAHSLRWNDYSLDEQQEAVHEVFTDFFRSLATSEVVRAADGGHDGGLWSRALETGVVSMAVPEAKGGDGATLVDLVLVAEQYGASLAPIPLVESVSGARLLASVDDAAATSLLARVLGNELIVTMALRPIDEQGRQLVPAGTIAGIALALVGDDLVAVEAPADATAVDNLGDGPVAWWDLGTAEHQVLASGPEARVAYSEAVRLWKLLTSAALNGSGGAALALAVDFAKSRMAFGQAIGTFQAISHALVDAEILVVAGRNLTRKAAWFAEYEPDVRRDLIPSAFLSSSRAAVAATTTAVHVQGGFGFTDESDVTLHFRRAKGWPLLAGRPSDDLEAIAADLPLPTAL